MPEYSNFMTLSGMLRNWGLWRPVVRIHPDEPSTKYEQCSFLFWLTNKNFCNQYKNNMRFVYMEILKIIYLETLTVLVSHIRKLIFDIFDIWPKKCYKKGFNDCMWVAWYKNLELIWAGPNIFQSDCYQSISIDWKLMSDTLLLIIGSCH